MFYKNNSQIINYQYSFQKKPIIKTLKSGDKVIKIHIVKACKIKLNKYKLFNKQTS